MEYYSKMFASAVIEGDVAAAMCSYNKVNGTYACENPWALSMMRGMREDVLIMSDWFAVSDGIASVRNGLDIEQS